MIIPTINTQGKFTFTAPFDTLVNSNQIFKVTGVRTLSELYNSEEKPLDTIYKAINLTEQDYLDDIQGNVPIVVFVTDSNEYFYVPADRIISEPDKTGVDYVEKSIIINIGYVPVDLDITTTEAVIKDDVYNTLGITSNTEVMNTSAKMSVDSVGDATFRALLASKKTVDKTYKTRYNELLAQLNAKDVLIAEMEQLIIAGRVV